MRILCWFGLHKFVLNRVIRHGSVANLMGHSCKRCGKIPEGQKAL